MQLIIDKEIVSWKEVDGIVVVLLFYTGNFFELNRVGSTIWKMIAEGNDSQEIAVKMAQIYDAPLTKIKADVDSYIEHMLKIGLLRQAAEQVSLTEKY